MKTGNDHCSPKEFFTLPSNRLRYTSYYKMSQIDVPNGIHRVTVVKRQNLDNLASMLVLFFLQNN